MSQPTDNSDQPAPQLPEMIDTSVFLPWFTAYMQKLEKSWGIKRIDEHSKAIEAILIAQQETNVRLDNLQAQIMRLTTALVPNLASTLAPPAKK